MKDIEVTIRIQNNQIKERRRILGMTQQQLAQAVGCTVRAISEYENLSSPFNNQGDWSLSAQKLANFFQVSPDELWPNDILNIKQNKAVRTMDIPELLLTSEYNERLALPPHEIIEQIDTSEKIENVLSLLTEREQYVIKLRFGFDENHEHTLEEVAEILEVTRDRVRQIESKAIRKLRHPSLNHKLKTKLPFDCWEVLELPSTTTDKYMVRWAARIKIEQLEVKKNSYRKYYDGFKKQKIEDLIEKIKYARGVALKLIDNHYNSKTNLKEQQI